MSVEDGVLPEVGDRVVVGEHSHHGPKYGTVITVEEWREHYFDMPWNNVDRLFPVRSDDGKVWSCWASSHWRIVPPEDKP